MVRQSYSSKTSKMKWMSIARTCDMRRQHVVVISLRPFSKHWHSKSYIHGFTKIVMRLDLPIKVTSEPLFYFRLRMESLLDRSSIHSCTVETSLNPFAVSSQNIMLNENLRRRFSYRHPLENGWNLG